MIGTMDAAALVKEARQRAGLTQRAVAERAGIRRQSVGQIESGVRNPSISTLVGLLAAAGLQMRVELEPLDADVLRLIEQHRELGDAGSDVAAVWDGFPGMRDVDYRIEGLAAAALLGAPVPVPRIDVALADTDATYRWLATQLRGRALRLRAPGWVSTLAFPWSAHGDDEPDEDGRVARETLAEECHGGAFWLEGPLDRLMARLAPETETARCVRVQTSTGTIRVQPLDDIESADPATARVLRVMRQSRQSRQRHQGHQGHPGPRTSAS